MPGIRALLRTSLFFVVGTTAFAASKGAVTPAEASRFLAQATLGADWEEIHRTAGMGYEAWLEEQFERPIGYHQPYLDQRLDLGLELGPEHRRWSWWAEVLEGPDPLRQRIALALSEHFVVSDSNDIVAANPIGLANYYDMLLDHTFGNFRDLLRAVTLHPIMGAYLSHLRNEKSAPAIGRFPDENYAREIMQLFSIGLYRLRQDGTFVLSGAGAPIPTYDNDDITQFAKIFTGLAFDGPDHDFHEGQENWNAPMRMYDQFHEPGPKQLLRGRYVPPGQTGMQDIEDALDNLFTHPNVGPFFARRMIQRLVTSNPSPAYVGRVAAAFEDNGAGVRGDMKAVISAVLLDTEARSWPLESAIGQGMLRESFLRRVHLARAFDASNQTFDFPISDGNAPVDFSQRPLSSPTVFNFFLPDHQPAGPIGDAGLVAPEFQIITAVTAISSSNALRTQVDGAMNFATNDAYEVRLDLTDEIAVAADPRALVDRLDLILMYGNMSEPMRQVLIHALEQHSDPVERTELAVHLISISPEYAVLK
jgi:uncharacterized protein (DUF1800 family)